MTLLTAPRKMTTTTPHPTPPDTPTDADLLTRYATTKDPTAFAQLASRYVDFVHSAARRQTRGSPHLTDDVTQAVFILLSQKAAAIKPHTLPGWLFNTTRNAARNAMKLDRRRRKHEAAAAAQAARIAAAAPSSSSDAPTWDDLAPELDRAVAKLGPGERDVLLLHYFQGHPLSTVATMLHITEPAARKRSSRAVEKLRDLLGARGLTASAPAIVALLHHHAVTPAPAAVSTAATSVATSTTVTTVTTATTIATATTQAAAVFKLKVLAATVLAATLATATTVVVARNRAAAPHVIPAATSIIPAPAADFTSAEITATVTPKSGPVDGKVLVYDHALGYLLVERQLGLVCGEWCDNQSIVHTRLGAPMALRLPVPAGAAENIRRKFTEFLAWQSAAATRAPNLDATIDNVPCRAYHVARLGNDPTPADVWIGPDNFPRRVHSVSPAGVTFHADCRFNTDVSAQLKSPFPPGTTTTTTTPPEIIDADAYAAREYPLDKALVTTESAGHTVAVHRAVRDPAGAVHLTISVRPTDATRALTGRHFFPNVQLTLAPADLDSPHRPAQLAEFAFGDTIVREDALLAPANSPIHLTVSVTTINGTYEALKSKNLPTNTRFKLTIPADKITAASMSRDQLLTQTYDHAAQIAPPADGGIIAPRPRGPAGPMPTVLQPKDKFLADVQKRLGA